MVALPPHLYEPCRKTLCRCREFENYEVLRAVFITEELMPFRIGLRQANSPESLVDLCLDHLLGKQSRNGGPILLTFIATLRERYDQNDILRNDLEDLFQALHQALLETPPLPKHTTRRKQMLFERLLQLDFRTQVRLFSQVIAKHRVAAFLIHGPPNHGQRMLAYRLSRLKPEWETGQHIVIDAGSNGTGKSSRSLWAQVANKMQLSSLTPTQELIDKVGKWLLAQDVIFTFHTVDYIPSDLLTTWIEEFWKPLVHMAKHVQHRTHRPTHLLLFLVDYGGDVSQLSATFIEYNTHWALNYKPLLLPPLTSFPREELEIWLDASIELLPVEVSVELLVTEPCYGIPVLVYDRICQYCGISWEGELAR